MSKALGHANLFSLGWSSRCMIEQVYCDSMHGANACMHPGRLEKLDTIFRAKTGECAASNMPVLDQSARRI